MDDVMTIEREAKKRKRGGRGGISTLTPALFVLDGWGKAICFGGDFGFRCLFIWSSKKHTTLLHLLHGNDEAKESGKASEVTSPMSLRS